MTRAWDAVAGRTVDLAGIEALHGRLARDIARSTGPDTGDASRLEEARKLSVLLVDDDEVDAKYISWVLGCIDRYSFDIVHVTSSEDALAADAGRRFDLYLVDFWLMHETSIPLINELGDLHTRAPIVVLTNLNSGDIEDLGIRAGALGFLGKGDLSEKALELVISSALFTRRVELEMKEQIAVLKAQRDMAFVSGQGALLSALAKLNTAYRACEDALAGSADGDASGENTLGAVAGGIVSARHDVFKALAGTDEPDATVQAPQRVDLRVMIDRALDAYRHEARLNGVGLEFDVPAEPLHLMMHPVMVQTFLIALVDRIARDRPKNIAIKTRLLPGSVRIIVTPDGVADLASPHFGGDAMRVIADCIGAEISEGEEAGSGYAISVSLPLAPAAASHSSSLNIT